MALLDTHLIDDEWLAALAGAGVATACVLLVVERQSPDGPPSAHYAPSYPREPGVILTPELAELGKAYPEKHRVAVVREGPEGRLGVHG